MGSALVYALFFVFMGTLIGVGGELKNMLDIRVLLGMLVITCLSAVGIFYLQRNNLW